MPKSTQSVPFEGEDSIESHMPVYDFQPETRFSIRKISGKVEEDLARALFILLIPIVIADITFHALSRALWFDEILTKLVASQRNIGAMWDRLGHGVTSHPPTFYFIEHVIAGFGGNDRLTFRLISMASFFCVMFCVYNFVRRRAGGLIALISASSLLLTLLYNFYAFEARPYAVMVACIALASLFYDRADSWRQAVMFALCLAAASSLNFYASLAFFPFGLVELIRLVTERKFRTVIWASFLVGLLPYIPFWSLLREQKRLFGVHSFALPSLGGLANALGEVVHVDPFFSTALFAAVLTYLIYLACSGEFKISAPGTTGSGFSLYDVVLIIGFVSIPVVTYIVMKIANGALSGRYVVITSFGVSLALGLLLSRLRKPAVLSVGLFVFGLFIFQEGMYARQVISPRERVDYLQSPGEMAESMNIPLVISNGLVFLPSWYRASDSMKSRLYFLADSEEQFHASGSDTTTVQMLTLKYLPLMNVDSFAEYAPKHRKFLLYSSGDSQDFWPRWLLQRGYSLRPLNVDPPVPTPMGSAEVNQMKAILYLVDLDKHN